MEAAEPRGGSKGGSGGKGGGRGGRSGGKGGGGGGKGGGGKGGRGGEGRGRLWTPDGDGGGRGGGGGQHGAPAAAPGKGTPRAKAGDTKEMGGITLVAVDREGSIKWEPLGGIDSVASRDAQRKVVQDEARWRKEMEASVKDARAQEAKDLARREQQRKAELFGAENVYRTSKARAPRLAVPPLLAQTREEEEAARKAGMDKNAPKQYQFIKESLDALEAQHAAKEQAARKVAYDRNRKRLNVSGRGDADGQADSDPEEEVEDLRTRLSQMSDDEFKQLAMERKKRAEAELASKEEASAVDITDGGGAGDGGKRGGKGGGDKGGGDKTSGGGKGGGKGGGGKSGGGKGGGGKGGGDKGGGGGGDGDSKDAGGGKAPGSGRGKGGGGGGGRGGRKKQELDPADDPDYRR